MRCDQCRTKIRGEGHRTATRILCSRCNEQFEGQAAGLMAGGGIANAISTSGWYQRVLDRTRGRKRHD